MAPQEPPKETDKPAEQVSRSTDGIVKAPVDTAGDKLPEGAVFTEVKSDSARPVATPAPIARSEQPVQSRPSAPEPKPAAEPSPSPAVVEELNTPQPAQRHAKAPAEEPKPMVAILIAAVFFVVLAVAAYLAYAQSN